MMKINRPQNETEVKIRIPVWEKWYKIITSLKLAHKM